MKEVCLLRKETIRIVHKCHYCQDVKRVGYVVAMDRGQAFSICNECGEEIIRRLNLTEISDSVWAPSDTL